VGENKLFTISDFDGLSVAVDIQVARITFYSGVLQIEGSYYGCIHHEPLRLLIEGSWDDASKNIGVPAWYLDEPLWSVGSRLCSKKRCYRCPIGDDCDRNFNIRFRGANVQII